MIDKKYERVLVTYINMGIVDGFFYIWLNAYWRAFIIAFPTIFIIVPQVRKLVGILVK